MEQWLSDHARPIMDSLVYSALGTGILLAAFWVTEHVLPFSIRKEITEDQNIGLGIILGSFIIGIALIISTAIR
jgi:putative membrane protein